MNSKSNDRPLLHREHPSEEPATAYDSKIVMLRAERHDHIQITDTITELDHWEPIPEEVTVLRRTSTYFGPKLLVEEDSINYLLTAPGPDCELLLWAPERTADGFRRGWKKLAEVAGRFADEQPQYDLCPVCNEPMQTLEHEREAAFGACPNAEL